MASAQRRSRLPSDPSTQVGRAVRERRSRRLVGILAVFLTAGVAIAIPAAAKGSPSPTGSPTVAPSPAPSPTDPPPSPSPSVAPTPSTSVSPAPSTDPSTSASSTPLPDASGIRSVPVGARHFMHGRHGDRVSGRLTRAEGRRHHRERSWRGWAPDPHWGTYGTAVLDRAARRARGHGWNESRIAKRIYAPFIVEGPATWSDSWGAPRWTGGYHPHHGQDVLCRYGAPVLAAEAGTIRFGMDPLGGRAAYLERDDGGFWYYAHLRSYARDLSTGDRVKVGRVIGRCGASGDASVPHLHFALFTADNEAVDPMPALVAWLRTAEHAFPGRHRDEPGVPAPVIVPSFHVTARAGSDGPDEPVEAAALVDRSEPTTGRQRALGTAAFMMLFGSALWGTPSARRRRKPATASRTR
jgi:murein DD-endopeptidase MepM/ murein hydrolase activator NlpD